MTEVQIYREMVTQHWNDGLYDRPTEDEIRTLMPIASLTTFYVDSDMTGPRDSVFALLFGSREGLAAVIQGQSELVTYLFENGVNFTDKYGKPLSSFEVTSLFNAFMFAADDVASGKIRREHIILRSGGAVNEDYETYSRRQNLLVGGAIAGGVALAGLGIYGVVRLVRRVRR
jgi:hypothetical protein